MKVCFFLGGFVGSGGIGRSTSILANSLADIPDIDVYALSYFKSDIKPLYTVSEKIVKNYLLNNHKTMLKALLSGGVNKLRKFIKHNKIDVLVACGSQYYLISVLACAFTDTKVVCWEHTSPYQNGDFKFQKIARLFGVRYSDKNIVITNAAQKIFSDEFKVKNVIRIYNPLDNNIFEHAGKYNADSNKIISVGRLSHPKYFEMAIEVAREVLKKYPDWSWDIYGTGELRDTLASLIQESGLEGKMNLMGQVSDLYDRYKNYSMLVMTSRYEGFPMTLLEGMGNGLPLVSFDIKTGPNEIIKDGANGFLIDAFDKDKMVERIIQLIEDKELRKSMSEMNLQMSKNFSEESIVNEWVTVLKELAQTKKA